MAAQGLDEPLPTLCAGGNHIGLAQPFLLNRHGDNGAVRAHSIESPTSTADGRGPTEQVRGLKAHGYLVEPFILSQASGGAPRAVEDPVPTIPGGGAHALLTPYYGSGSGKTCNSTEQPLPTVTTRERFGLVMPVTHSDKSNRARSIDDPLPTVTTAARVGLQPTGLTRGELAFITAAFGERTGQTPRIHDITQPAPTICAQGRIQLVEPVKDGEFYDIRFRMLEPKELARAMGFSDEEAEYEFAGNKSEVVKQIGNAVSVNLASALVYTLMAN